MFSLISWLGKLHRELRRRSVFRVAAVYAVVAWLVIQVAAITFPALQLPEWTVTFVIAIVALGFPLALVLAWAFEVTPEGVRRTRPAAGAEESGEPAPTVSAPARAAAGIGAVALIGILAWSTWEVWLEANAGEPSSVPVSDARDYDPARIAVLYFDDYSDRDAASHVANGLTEALIHRLSQIEALDVVSRNGVRPFRSGEAGTDSIARELKVGTLVEGSVQRSGDSLRVTVQLIDTETNTHLDSWRTQRPWGELFDLQDRVAEEVSTFLRERLGRQVRLREWKAGTRSVEAWELVQRAHELRDDAEELEEENDLEGASRALARADSVLRRAQEQDVAWPEPTIQRGWIALERARLGKASSLRFDRTMLERAEQLASEAEEPDSASPGALELRGIARRYLARVENDEHESAKLLEAAEADFRAAVGADDGRARAWSDLSEVLREQGRFEEARIAARRALEADAYLDNASDVFYRLAHVSLELRDQKSALKWVSEGRQRFPEDRSLAAEELVILASGPSAREDVGRAWRLQSFLRERTPSRLWPSFDLQVAAVLAGAGLADSAAAVIRHAREEEAENPMTLYYEAYARLRLDQRDRALSLLEEYLQRLPQDRSYLAHDWWFEPLWEDPRFKNLVDGEAVE